jgi:hypothetical protein
MIDRDPTIETVLQRLVPASTESGDWRAVVRDARVRRRRRLAALLVPVAAVVAVAGGALLWPFSGGQQASVLDRALAAVGDGPVLHVVFRGDWGGTTVNLQTGERTPVYADQEIWYDADRGLVHQLDRLGGTVEYEYTSRPLKTPPDLAALSGEYRQALNAGTARVRGDGIVEGEPVYWIVYRSEMLPDVADGRDHEFAQEIAVSKETFKPVAIRDTRDGIALREGSTRRVLELETVAADDADFTASSANVADRLAYKEGRAPITLDQAAEATGARPLWLGREYRGFPLAQVARTVTATGRQTQTELHGQAAADARACFGQKPPAAGREGAACERMRATGHGVSIRDGGRVYAANGPVVWGPDRTGVSFFYGTIADDPSTFKEDPRPDYRQPYVSIIESTHREASPREGVGYVPPDGSIFISAGHSGFLRRDGLYVTISASSEDPLLAAARALEPMPG